ncbi:MAG: site-2 protease family protein [Pirellulaceae bacterium]
MLFLITCVSTFLAGVTDWMTMEYLMQPLLWRRAVLTNWPQGLIYMVAVLSILMTHEMGHFIATLRHRIPASLPFFIPFPLSPIGTMGAVIGMAGFKADRKQVFDIGVAGPIAGLVVAIPILFFGIRALPVPASNHGPYLLDCPMIVRLMFTIARPEYVGTTKIAIGNVNPLFMAGWVGLLITGLNMLPVSQLDGGHVIYALFLKRGHVIARGFLMVAIAYVVFARVQIWIVMLILVTLMGTDHPPTRNDNIPLGPVRTLIAWLSLLIPVLCFPPQGLIVKM